ncbi:major facilitator superfamily domain-containing protein [Bisporella sp. PMI_857]|nr:major facilitator superfamily domain-containing protein [Bisporella sp. PMI_857]
MNRRSSVAHSSHSDSTISTFSHHSDARSPVEDAGTLNVNGADEQPAYQSITRTKTSTSGGTTGSRIPSFEVDFTENDPEDPRGWPMWYRYGILGIVSYATWTVVLYSTSYTSSIPGMSKEFGISSQPVLTLGITTYLTGLAAGSLILAPLSEIYGRRPVYVVCMGIYCLMVLPCALGKDLATILVVRFFGACAGASMLSNAPGTVGDVVTENYRALAFSIWSLGPMNGPVTGPLIGGFTAEYLGWRWTNWLVMILAGVAWLMCATFKETYAPVILRKRAEKMRKETGDDRYWSRYDERMGIVPLLKINLARPIVLAVTEPILWFWNLYIGIIYAILYLCFVAYPFIFGSLRGWSLGITGLAFAGIGIGTTLAIAFEPLVRKMINSHKKDPTTGRVAPEACVSIICIASLLSPIGQLWFSWTSTPATIHWVWPILAGIPFGAGNCLVFVYSASYIAGCYGIYSASALAGNAVIRSTLGGTLPLAGALMYKAMTPRWAGTFLGLVQVILIPIPWAFYKYGDKIRSKSPLIRQMREDQEKSEARAARAKNLAERKRAQDNGAARTVDEKEVGGEYGEKTRHPLTHTITS